MESAINAIFEVLSFGAIIVLVVLGLGIIASMMGIFNFAHGELVLLGAYMTYIVHDAGLPVWAGMLAAPFVVGSCGLVLERLVIRRFYAAPKRMPDADRCRRNWGGRSWRPLRRNLAVRRWRNQKDWRG